MAKRLDDFDFVCNIEPEPLPDKLSQHTPLGAGLQGEPQRRNFQKKIAQTMADHRLLVIFKYPIESYNIRISPERKSHSAIQLGQTQKASVDVRKLEKYRAAFCAAGFMDWISMIKIEGSIR